MKLDFLHLPAEERNVYFEQAAYRQNISTVVLEKDFWVCWLLGILFESEFAPSLVFKGGTSLAKVFGAIDRFSEDIDLSLSPDFLGLPAAGPTRTQADKWIKNAEAQCAVAVQLVIAPRLEAVVAASLDGGVSPRLEYLADPQTQSPILLFHYPSLQPAGFDYLKRAVKLEFGSLTDQQPTGRHGVRPWIADAYPDAFLDWRCEVVALDVERTFWEKATILHTEHYRPEHKPTPDRYSRHYADLAALADHPRASSAVDKREICERVVRWKSRFFGSKWAHYELAKPGTFRLIPPSARLAALGRDYEAMRDMYLSPPPSFDEILSKLTELEARINRPTDDE